MGAALAAVVALGAVCAAPAGAAVTVTVAEGSFAARSEGPVAEGRADADQ